jgi:3-oxoadipate enol-lactonase
MPHLTIDDKNRLFYLYTAPTTPAGKTFVFFNALTGETTMWEGVIGDHLRAKGHGTLSFNFRGQTDSDFDPSTELTPDLIVEDARRLINHINPPNIVLTGLSIGGLFAARAWLDGLNDCHCDGMVLINTLRRDGSRLKWINDALVRCVSEGGLEMFRDFYAPLLFNEDWQQNNRDNFLGSSTYQPIDKQSGHYNLLHNADQANWDLPYEDLTLPVLLITGLQDRVFLDHDDLDILGARIPNAKRIDMKNAAHLLPAERPEELAHELLNFAENI